MDRWGQSDTHTATGFRVQSAWNRLVHASYRIRFKCYSKSYGSHTRAHDGASKSDLRANQPSIRHSHAGTVGGGNCGGYLDFAAHVGRHIQQHPSARVVVGAVGRRNHEPARFSGAHAALSSLDASRNRHRPDAHVVPPDSPDGRSHRERTFTSSGPWHFWHTIATGAF